jgi:hypothetical protein
METLQFVAREIELFKQRYCGKSQKKLAWAYKY